MNVSISCISVVTTKSSLLFKIELTITNGLDFYERDNCFDESAESSADPPFAVHKYID